MLLVKVFKYEYIFIKVNLTFNRGRHVSPIDPLLNFNIINFKNSENFYFFFKNHLNCSFNNYIYTNFNKYISITIKFQKNNYFKKLIPS